MLGLFTRDDKNAIDILKNDHDRVKNFFDQFDKAEDSKSKLAIVTKSLRELKLHASVEEEIFYPAVRKQLEKKTMNEADEEHHVAKVLIAELEEMDGSEDHYDAKFTVLAENIRHHIKEEERDMLPKAKSLSIDFEKLGDEIQRRKEDLIKNGFPKVGEEKMVAAVRGQGDSPAKAARKKSVKSSPRRSKKKASSK